jgi:hypothetical protein
MMQYNQWMSKTLHLTHPEFDVSLLLSSSVLLTNVNQQLSSENYHTSLGDLSASEVLSISSHFDVINFVPNKFDVNSSIYHETAIVLNYLSHKKTLTGYAPSQPQEFLSLDVHDRPNRPIVWVFGCSHSHGVGLTADQQNFGQHISQHTELPLKLIAKPGSSVQWSLRHLIHAAFQEGDFVIWQLTSPERISYGYPPSEFMLRGMPFRHLLETYNDQQLLFHQLSLFNQGIQHLKCQDVKFSVISISGQSSLFYPCLTEYSKHPEFCHVPNYLLDLGTDGRHMGPLSHKALAKSILNHVHYSNE